VSLSLSHAQDLESIRTDKRQLELVMMNLVVNARDAMPTGGEIRIVTQNFNLAEQMVRDRATVPPGE
jgi:two-component system cell cycle sensor histidine kinase/response regulator CckA